MPETIGLIGVGLLGAALGERFIGAGYDVLAYDTDSGRLGSFQALGGDAAESASQVAFTCRRIVLSLPDSDAVRDVIDSCHEHFASGALIIDTTTGGPEQTRQVGERLERINCGYIDATVVGSSEQARHGVVLALVGGHPSAVRQGSDLLRAFAKAVHHVGPCGHGARMKLIVNLVLGLNRAVLAEGLAFAQACDLDPAGTLKILRQSVAYSRVMDNKGDKMVSGDFTTQARVSQHLKDVNLILQQGGKCGAYLPLSASHRELLEEVVEQGSGDADNSAIITAYPYKPEV